jgi:hydrogenase maturation protease
MSGFPEIPYKIGPAPILVLGLGNTLLSDDAVGSVLVEKLAERKCSWNKEVDLVDGGTQGLALLGHLSGRPAVIILDAVKMGAPPGTVHRLTLPELRSLSSHRSDSGHESNAWELLAAAELLNELPGQLFVVGVEPETITTGVLLSSAVQEALPAAAEQVECLLNGLKNS